MLRLVTTAFPAYTILHWKYRQRLCQLTNTLPSFSDYVNCLGYCTSNTVCATQKLHEIRFHFQSYTSNLNAWGKRYMYSKNTRSARADKIKVWGWVFVRRIQLRKIRNNSMIYLTTMFITTKDTNTKQCKLLAGMYDNTQNHRNHNKSVTWNEHDNGERNRLQTTANCIS